MPAKTANPAAEAAALAAQAAEAQALAEEARNRAEEAAQRAEARRQAEIATIRRRRLEEYDEEALRAEEREGERQFRQAVEDGRPGIHEFVAWQEVVGRHYLLASEARSIQTAMEPDAPAISTPGVASLSYADAVQRVVVAMLANRTADFEDARQEEFDRAGL